MAGTYEIRILSTSEGAITLGVSFGVPAQNDALVRDAMAAMDELSLPGGKAIRFNGPASLPVAMALCHRVAHLFGYVACDDPKLQKYVVAVSHDPVVKPGDLMD